MTGGSSGIGRGIVEALAARKAQVTVIARDPARLARISQELGVEVRSGDVTDREVAREVLQAVRPNLLVLNAGATTPMGPIHELDWEAFSSTWNQDVKAGLFWIQEALRLPLPRKSRVIMGSSGAALRGSPMSGGYAGAKRMLWLMADYANGVSTELELGIRFQALLPLQIIGGTGVGDHAAEIYAARRGLSKEQFLAGFGKALSPRDIGEHVVSILTDARYEAGVAFGVKGESGIVALDG